MIYSSERCYSLCSNFEDFSYDPPLNKISLVINYEDYTGPNPGTPLPSVPPSEIKDLPTTRLLKKFKLELTTESPPTRVHDVCNVNV